LLAYVEAAVGSSGGLEGFWGCEDVDFGGEGDGESERGYDRDEEYKAV
jgi:hypothetical protein